MTTEEMRAFLGWCLVLDIGILMFWFAFIVLAGDFVYGIHGKMFKLSREAFDAINYGGMGLFKMGIWMLNLIPYLALHIVG